MRGGLVTILFLVAALAGCAGGDGGGPREAAMSADNSTTALNGLAMDGAEVTYRNDTLLIFTWNGTFPEVTELLTGSTVDFERADFDLPIGVPFAVNVSLAWEEEARLEIRLASPELERMCANAGPGEAACQVESLAHEQATRWAVYVDRPLQPGQPLGPWTGEISFQVELEIRVLDADAVPDAPTLVPAMDAQADPTAPGWPSLSDAGIRPGIKMYAPPGSCTLNFVFSTPDNASLYIGTASHCIPEGARLGDAVPLAADAFEGRVAYCSFGASHNLLHCPTGTGVDDFALIEIPGEHRDEVHPAMLTWGGPKTVGPTPDPGTTVLTYGNSNNRDTGQDANVVDSRAGVVATSDGGHTRAYFGPPSIAGDSGSPVITAEGSTVGTLATLGVSNLAGSNGIWNLDHSLTNLEDHTGRTVELKTWPLFDVPRVEPVVPGAQEAISAE